MIILSLLLAMQAAESPASQTIDPATQRPISGPALATNLTEVRLNECLDLSIEDPAAGIFAANEWKIDGGDFFADHCLGFAYAVDFKFELAMDAFESAAQGAARVQDDRSARFWLQAANSAIAAQKPLAAIGYIDAALALQTLEGEQLGEAHLDKARALVGLDLEDQAGEQLLLAQKFVPQDPLVWLLSATLSRRQGNIEQARSAIDVAARLVPTDPAIALEQGNIEIIAGNYTAAQAHWRNALAIKSDGRVADTVRSLLAQLENDPPAPDDVAGDAAAAADKDLGDDSGED